MNSSEKPLFTEKCPAWDYHVLNGCWSCGHVFFYYDHDCDGIYYCNYLNIRPVCDSLEIGEMKSFPVDQWDDLAKKWHEWADKHQVHPSGMCCCRIKRKENHVSSMESGSDKEG